MDFHRPHDALFRFAFSDPEQARTLLRSRMMRDKRYRGLARRLDWSKLERVDLAIADAADRPHAADLLFRVPFGARMVHIHVVLEHKSHPDRMVAWQVTRYGVRLIDRLHQQLGCPRDLPIVIGIVFYHGDETWTAPRDVNELFDLPTEWSDDERAALRPMLPSWTYLLDDLKPDLDERLEDVRDDLVARISLEALVRLRDPDAEQIPLALVRLRELLVAVMDAPRGKVLLGVLFSYLAATTRVDLQTVNAAVKMTLPRRTTEAMLNPLEKYIQEKCSEAETKGLSEGLSQGEAKGREVGQVELLRRQLTRRFGPLPADVMARLDRATTSDLESWALRILDATTPADVFA